MYEQVAIDGSNGETKFLKVSHNSVLNCLFLLTSNQKLIVYDLNSNKILKQVDWNLKQHDGKYYAHFNKTFFSAFSINNSRIAAFFYNLYEF